MLYLARPWMRHRRSLQVSIVVQFGRLESFTTLRVRAKTDRMCPIFRPGSYQGNTLWRLGSAADGHHARRRYTIRETPTTDRTEGRDQEDQRTILFQVSESGSIILTAHSFLPSLAEMRLGWASPSRELRPCAHPGASHCARQSVLTVLAHALRAISLTILNPISNWTVH